MDNDFILSYFATVSAVVR